MEDSLVKFAFYGSIIPQFIINLDHKIIHWNNALGEATHTKASEMIGTSFQWKAFYKTERPCLVDLVVDNKEEELLKRYEGKIHKRGLEGIYEAVDFFPQLGSGGAWFRFTATKILDSSNKVVAAMETLEDITEIKNAEIQIIKNSDELKKMNEFMVDREMRMTELKQQLKTLETKYDGLANKLKQ